MSKDMSIVGEKEAYELKELYDTIVINTAFDKNELIDYSIINFSDEDFKERFQSTTSVIDKAASLLKEGGLLFVYGLPKHLPHYATYLNRKKDDGYFMFKYWIALEYKPKILGSPLPNSHLGTLMYLKTKNRFQINGFRLNTKINRVAYNKCVSCKQDVKDWGGKKHLKNKLGSAISDVWTDLSENLDTCEKIPESALKRIYDLVYFKDIKFLVINQDKRNIKIGLNNYEKKGKNSIVSNEDLVEGVIKTDSFALMESLANKYPNGIFDLVFADPPYNLAKSYNDYVDSRSGKEYIQWCNKWLNLMSRVLKPGGALLVLNIPKWAVYHAEYLNTRMELRHWIVWDAMSTPAGKLMPAHYSLLYYTKPGSKPKPNFEKVGYIDSREYCLRSQCISIRKSKGSNKKELLSDIWHDVHRIKHKKDRDEHPCQLPIKLMNRIVLLTTNKNDWVFDPFGGAGTTAVSAKLNQRHYLISDIDEKYVEISKKNLSNVQKDSNGNNYLLRDTVHRTKPEITKREIETNYINLCKRKNKLLYEDELKIIDPSLYFKIKKYYGDFKRLIKITRRLMEIETEAKQLTQIIS